ncbi:hypothetical protein FRC02_003643 [Tulasnella sp. 418]|nr:hypothetical protein FRC02_003643 [Tulasnella sp. 418]
MSTVDQVESKVKLSKGQKKKKSAQKKKAAQKTAVEEEHRQRLEDDERKIDQQDAVLLDRYCDYTLKTQDVADDNDNYKSSYFDRVTRNRLNMLRASYKSRIRMATLVPIEFGAIENPLYMGIASKYIPPLKEDELEKETGPVVLKETLTTDDLDREHINTNWAFTKESFGVALAIWYPIFMECFLRGDKLSCAALRDTSMQLRACWNVFRGDITRLDQFVR